MEQYNVTGMSCAACSAIVEKAVSAVPGVTACSVSLLTNSMGVEGNASSTEIINAVEKAGYGASPKGREKNQTRGEDELRDKETPTLVKRLITSVIFLAVLMSFSMGHRIEDVFTLGLIELLLSAIVMVINQKFFISGFKGAIHRAPNMDTLVALGSGAAFVYSTYSLFLGRADFYFESSAMILTLITVGKLLEAKSKGRTTDALKSLMKLAPKTANIIQDGQEKTVPIETVQPGDVFVVRPGENIPVDGLILEGDTAINESALTGESIPVDKTVGSKVSAATINQSGFIKCEATRVGEDTTLSQIIKMVSDAAATKAPIAKVADRVSGVFVPIVIIIALVATVVWLLAGESLGFALARGISVLVISCPCALGLATPVAIMVGNGMGAKNGILFKTAVSLEETGKATIIALDKTGTITSGEPKVTDIVPADGVEEKDLLNVALSLEQNSEHPLSRAILEYAKENNIEPKSVSEFKALPGNGLTATLENDRLLGGNMKFIASEIQVPDTTLKTAELLAQSGKTPLLFTKNEGLLGIIAVADVIKPDAKQAICELQNMGTKVYMITGDNEQTARAIGKQAGVDEVIAGVLPSGKSDAVLRLKKNGKVIMVGDGINDAPALKTADIGIAIGAGTDVAIDTADVVLMNSHMLDVPAAIRLSRATLKNIHENLFWAFFYNVIGIPLAAGVWIPLFGLELNPMFGAAAMSLSSFCVVTNALRLNLIKVHDSKRDRRINNNIKKQKEIKTMTKTLKIEGMMCGHCEASVKGALEAIDGVESADVSHESGTAVVTMNKDVDSAILKKAVEDKDYKVISVD